jgi:hypothetical protein
MKLYNIIILLEINLENNIKMKYFIKDKFKRIY